MFSSLQNSFFLFWVENGFLDQKHQFKCWRKQTTSCNSIWIAHNKFQVGRQSFQFEFKSIYTYVCSMYSHIIIVQSQKMSIQYIEFLEKSNKNPQNIQTNRQYQTLQICKHGDYREHNFRYYIDILVVIFVTYEIYMCTSFVIFCTFLVFHYHCQSSKVRNPIEPKERTPPF